MGGGTVLGPKPPGANPAGAPGETGHNRVSVQTHDGCRVLEKLLGTGALPSPGLHVHRGWGQRGHSETSAGPASPLALRRHGCFLEQTPSKLHNQHQAPRSWLHGRPVAADTATPACMRAQRPHAETCVSEVRHSSVPLPGAIILRLLQSRDQNTGFAAGASHTGPAPSHRKQLFGAEMQHGVFTP